MTLGQRLHHLRRLRHLTQADVARALGAGTTQQRVSSWESDDRQIPSVVLPALARVLQLPSIDTLFDDADPRTTCQATPRSV